MDGLAPSRSAIIRATRRMRSCAAPTEPNPRRLPQQLPPISCGSSLIGLEPGIHRLPTHGGRLVTAEQTAGGRRCTVAPGMGVPPRNRDGSRKGSLRPGRMPSPPCWSVRLTAAAQAAGVGRAAVRRRLRYPDRQGFRAYLERGRRDMRQAVKARLLTPACMAAGCLEGALADGDGKAAPALLKGWGLLPGRQQLPDKAAVAEQVAASGAGVSPCRARRSPAK